MAVCRLYAQCPFPNTLTPGDHTRSTYGSEVPQLRLALLHRGSEVLVCHTLGFYFYKETDKFKETAGLGKRSQERISHVAFQTPGSVK